MCGRCGNSGRNSGRNTFVRKLWITYITNIEVHFVCYLCITDLINARKMEHIKQKFLTVNFVWSLVERLNDKFVAQECQVCCSSQWMFQNPAVNLSATCSFLCEDRVLCVRFDLHVPLYWQQHQKCEPSIGLVYPPFFCKPRSLSNTTN